MNKIVIALGGNALGKTPIEQLELVKNTAKQIVEIVKEGNEVVIAHGNGPQVGIINLAFENASKNDSTIPSTTMLSKKRSSLMFLFVKTSKRYG